MHLTEQLVETLSDTQLDGECAQLIEISQQSRVGY